MSNKSVIIFGGSRGIGLTVADLFVRSGFHITIAARTQDQVDRTVKELSAKGEVQGYVADVSLFGGVKAAIDTHLKVFGCLDVVINAAAMQGPIGPLWQNNPLSWKDAILVNLVGGFHVCNAALSFMLQNGYGTIILFSGGGAAYARPYFSAYGASKAGVLRLIETIYEEVKEDEKVTSMGQRAIDNKHKGIRIYGVAPGAVTTRMTEEVIAQKEMAGEKAYQEALETILKGETSPERAAELCLYLSNERPECLSGRLIHVNEPYRDYVKHFEGRDIREVGLLRRIPFK